MSVETPSPREPITPTRAPKTAPVTDGAKVKAIGEGTIAPPENPFESLLLPSYAQEEYEATPPEEAPAEVPQATPPAAVSKGVTAGAWGGYQNGRIPAAALAAIAFARGQMMEQNAARALEAMNAAYKAETGRDIGITDSYRSLKGQQNVARTKPNLAAKPGTSVHGWGKALDLNIKGDPALKAWLDDNAGRFGFVNPDWAKKSSRYEPWHWEYTGGGSAPAAAAAPAAKKPASSKPSPQATRLINRARQFVGTPFRWGGAGPLGFDQSGFTQYVYRDLGINLPRLSYQQAGAGKRISVDQLRPGDLVAWDTSSRNNGADHIAVYIGNGQIIHAPKPGDRVKISPLYNTKAAWGVAMNL